MTRPYVLGLTGNIATGKSTVAAMLAELGADVIDCDQVAHEVMAPGGGANAAVAARFSGVQRDDGSIDRQALARIVFADAAALADLEALVHPAVLAESARRVAAAVAPVVVVEAIKLFEAGMDQDCDEVWAVHASREVQLRRLVDLRRLEPAEAEARIAAQPDPAEKLARSSRVVVNDGSLEQAWRQVLQGWNEIPAAQPVDFGQPLPARWATADGDRHGFLLSWAVLAVLLGGLAALNWGQAQLSALNRAAVLGLCTLTAGVCAWVVSRC